MGEALKTVLAFLCGAGGLAIINALFDRWKWKSERKAKKEDHVEERREKMEEEEKKKSDKLDQIESTFNEYVKNQEKFNAELLKKVNALEEQNEALRDGLKYMLLDRILYLGQKYIDRGEVSFDNRRRLGEMHEVYHKGLEGNGDADKVMDGVYELPLEKG